VKPARTRCRQLDDLGEGSSAALLREPEERDQDLGRGERVGKRSMARLRGRAEEVRELPE